MGVFLVLLLVVILLAIVSWTSTNYSLAWKLKGHRLYPVVGTWTVMLKNNGNLDVIQCL